MNLVFVNHMHPTTPHVSGMRSWFFARELAKRGHRVVQVCEWREGTEAAASPETVAQQLQSHDWAEPLLLAVRPQRRFLLELVRSPRTPVTLRKAFVTWSYLRHSGMFTDFSGATLPYLEVLSRSFRPQATWGLFGNTDCWLVAQRLARLSGCPWVADMKDSWEVFLRRPLRAPIAKRFQDMAACTANAAFNAEVLARWFPPQPAVIYSGVDPSFLETPPAPRDAGGFRLTLTGSVHDVAALTHFVAGLRKWLAQSAMSPQSGAPRLEVIYAGADSKKVGGALRPLEGLARVHVNGYLPLPELAALCRSATANAYIWNPKTFHHKLLELLSCGRPVIAFPGETDESHRLAVASGGNLLICKDAETLSTMLTGLTNDPSSLSAISRRLHFSWTAQSLPLENVLKEAVLKEAQHDAARHS